MIQTKTLATINGQQIQMIENGVRLVPIRPICQALGIDEDVQKRKIEADDLTKSVATLRVATGSDGKQYEMFCIPFKYVFGWLFSINAKNVKEEAKEAVIAYKAECYDVLYNHFTAYSDFHEERSRLIEERVAELDELRERFNTSKKLLAQARENLSQTIAITFDEWKESKSQLKLFV